MSSNTALPRNAVLVAGAYGVLALVGLVVTWYFNLTYRGGDYVGDWFANAASSSAAVDILVVFVVCTVFYVRESRRLGWRAWVPLLFAALSLVLAVAFAFPLFLALREIRLARAGRSSPDRGARVGEEPPLPAEQADQVDRPGAGLAGREVAANRYSSQEKMNGINAAAAILGTPWQDETTLT